MGGLSISGGRTNNTIFLLDGAANVDPDYSSINYSPQIDAKTQECSRVMNPDVPWGEQ